jgi:glyoxylase-like metal-dependent hydrolase (beta-lactamase superfamily II)
LITHAHPDHYGGSVELVGSDEIPIIAAEGVDAVIRRDDELKEESSARCSATSGRGSAASRIRRWPTENRSASTACRSP